jgi:DNA replication ATP-dependent helicase Dna2
MEFTKPRTTCKIIVRCLFSFLFGVLRYRRVRDAMPLLRGWADRFLQPGKPPQTAAFDDKPKTPLKINKVLDIEQSVWSPMWGMTGKIDMVVQVERYLREKNKSLQFVQAQLDNGASVVMPLELKTGPTPPERMGQTGHRAQVILYTVMLEQVYRCRVDAGS